MNATHAYHYLSAVSSVFQVAWEKINATKASKAAAIFLAGGSIAAAYFAYRKYLDSKIPVQWVIRPDHFKIWTKIRRDDVLLALKNGNVKYKIIPELERFDFRASSIKDRPINLLAESYEVISNDGVSRTILVKENGRYHLLVAPSRTASLEEISDQDFYALRRRIDDTTAVFQQVFGSADYGERLVKVGYFFAFELFPCMPKKEDEVDILAKDMRNIYIYTEGQYCSFGLAADKIDALRSHLLNPPQERPERKMLRVRTEVNWKAAYSFKLQLLMATWAMNGCPVARLSSHMPTPLVSDVRNLETKKCVFCAIPPKERLMEGKYIDIVVNFRPYFGKEGKNCKCLLIVVKRHLEDWALASKEELLEERQAILKIQSAFLQLFPRENVIVYKQQGVHAGMTVPHLHTQVMCFRDSEIPDYLFQLIGEKLGMPSAPVIQENRELTQLLNPGHSQSLCGIETRTG